MKACKYILSALLAIMFLAVPAFAIDLPAGTGDAFYVQDTANVLSSETERLIVDYNTTLEDQCDQAQLVVVTVNYLAEDSDIAATRLMNDWGVGSANKSNGMLLLLVAKEGRGWLAVGDGLDEVFTDDMAGLYLDKYFWDYIDDGQYDKGVQALTKELYNWYLDHYDAYPSTGVPATNSGGVISAVTRGIRIAMVFLVIVVILVLVWVFVSMRRFTRMRRWGYTGSFYPVFWVGGGRRYRDWRRRQPPPPPPMYRPAPHRPPAPPHRGPHGPVNPTTRRPSAPSRPSAPRSGGGRPGGFGGGPRGGGFGGHSGGGGGGRR